MCCVQEFQLKLLGQMNQRVNMHFLYALINVVYVYIIYYLSESVDI